MRHTRRPRGWRLHTHPPRPWFGVAAMVLSMGIALGVIVGFPMGLVLALSAANPVEVLMMTVGRAIVFAILGLVLLLAAQILRK